MFFRKAILLVHGFAGGIWDYGSLANDLQLYLDFDVYTFTLPGHDKIVITNVHRDDWIKAAEAQMDKLIARGYKKIYVVGHSMGGVIATHLASKYKEVKKLVLAAPAFKYLTFKNDKFNLLSSLKQTPDIVKTYSLETVISKMFKMPINTSIEFMKLVKEHSEDPKKVFCPTLIIHGNDDRFVPTIGSDYVYNNINSKCVYYYTFDNVTHEVYAGKRADEIIKLTTHFLRNNYIPTKVKKNIK